ncbi:tetratricopeptide repeat protein [Hyphomicrobium denitrificans]|uniref:tetratricopeptide repeat protein n=1 Tax=Hyphomicrobium denitrificans TaxID=53399 RepID=UPI00059C3358|nr:tetratricopeptide repeat protein [Hyphomicrobium denitrificans]
MLIIIGFLCGATGCDRPDTSAGEGMDRQTCLGSELAPIDALAACSRFIVATDSQTLNRSDAYYNRGVAFADLGELHHAKLDLEHALKLDPENRWARQRLETVNQTLSRTGG